MVSQAEASLWGFSRAYSETMVFQGMGREVGIAERSLSPSGKKGWVCISKEKLK